MFCDLPPSHIKKTELTFHFETLSLATTPPWCPHHSGIFTVSFHHTIFPPVFLPSTTLLKFPVFSEEGRPRCSSRLRPRPSMSRLLTLLELYFPGLWWTLIPLFSMTHRHVLTLGLFSLKNHSSSSSKAMPSHVTLVDHSLLARQPSPGSCSPAFHLHKDHPSFHPASASRNNFGLYPHIQLQTPGPSTFFHSCLSGTSTVISHHLASSLFSRPTQPGRGRRVAVCLGPLTSPSLLTSTGPSRLLHNPVLHPLLVFQQISPSSCSQSSSYPQVHRPTPIS